MMVMTVIMIYGKLMQVSIIGFSKGFAVTTTTNNTNNTANTTRVDLAFSSYRVLKSGMGCNLIFVNWKNGA